ncbi:MAG TPA: serine/threonine-protein kinase, partial [Rhodanobacteraceae bacterium]|nr:serine/threonine-protein kinase [Rhodanobacteraceae bacterium]
RRDGDGFVQRGALKLIKRGMDSDAVLARFRRERQILSSLEHPNIARLLDGGLSADGQSYFVMEYVAGQTLRQWLIETRPDLTQRVAVFLELADAVGAAHKHLVVHRDIKPDNVLVAADGHVRLLDFGIAKLLEGEGASEQTVPQARFVSPSWAAPEQLQGELVTTATDVYQLGLILSELLSGTRFAAAHPSAPLPSGDTRPLPGPERKALPRLKGDVGIIVRRATDPDPQRRYATVEALRTDVRAWQQGRPIAARDDSAGYRLRRFIGRHRTVAALLALSVLAIVGGASLALWQAHKAAGEARLARASQAFLVSVFEASAPDTAAGEHITARELLDRGSERLDTELAAQPRLRSEMQLTLGSLYSQLGQYQQARALLSAAHDALPAWDAAAAARAGIDLAVVERQLGQLTQADQLLANMPALDDLALQSRRLAERAALRERQDRLDEGLADARAALALDLGRGAAALAEQSRDRQIEALLLTRQAHFKQATASFAQALTDARRVYGAEDTHVARMLNDYGSALSAQGRNEDAVAMLQQALVIRRKRLGDKHPAVAETLQNLGATLRALGRMDEAQAALQEALRVQRQVFGSHHTEVANTLNSLAMLDYSRGKLADSVPLFREAVGIYHALGQGDTSAAATTSNNLGSILLKLGQYDAAEPLMRDALAVHLKRLGPKHPMVMSVLNSLGQLELRRGNYPAAVAYARRAVAVVDGGYSPPRVGEYVRIGYANTLVHAGDCAHALPQIDAAIAAIAKLNPHDPRLTLAKAVRADALLGLGQSDAALPLAEQVLAERRRDTPGNAEALALAHALLARVARARHDRAGARREQAQAEHWLAGVARPDPYLRRELQRR